MNSQENRDYRPAQAEKWHSRVDGHSPSFHRWHQVLKCIDLEEENKLTNSVVFLGFCCDQGVRRNHGRVGAKDAPDVLRSILAGLPVHFHQGIKIVDAGDVVCHEDLLEQAQNVLAKQVSQILLCGGFPILIGGGHEITYGHYNGIKQAYHNTVGIINIDAHLDIRKPIENKGNSGTSFFQIAEDSEKLKEPFNYLALGVQDISNTQALFDYADQHGVEIIRASEIHHKNLDSIIQQIQEFGNRVDKVYLTIDLDAFAAPYSPGVSAVAFNGIIPSRTFQRLFSAILHLPNLCSVDIAELNPIFDVDQRTAKLAADLLFKVVQKF